MNIFIRAWRSFLYRTRGVRLKHRVCGFGKKMNKRALLVCVPDHSNIGDMAIAVAEKVFLKSCGISFVSLTTEECDRNLPMLKKAVKSDTRTAVGGSTVLIRINEEAELLVDLFLCKSEAVKHLLLKLIVCDTDRAG